MQAQRRQDLTFLKIQAIRTNSGQTYKYIIHQRPKPYIRPSTSTKAGTTKTIFQPKVNVNIISQKEVSSILGKKDKAALEASIIATIAAAVTISLTVILLILLFLSEELFINSLYYSYPTNLS